MFFKGLWGYLPANILQGVIGFATLILFTRVLTPDDYGRYALALGIASLAQTTCFTWLEASMARFYPAEARNDSDAPELYGTIYRLFAVVSVLFAIVTIGGLCLWPVSDATGHAVKTAMGLSLGCVVFRSLMKIIQEQRKSEGRVSSASMMDMVQTGGAFALGAGCAYAGVGGASPLVGAGLMALFCLPFFGREDVSRALRGRFTWQKAKQYAHYGFPISASLILTLALYTADRFLIAYFLNDGEAGAYHAGFSLAARILDVLFIWFGAAGCPAMVHALESGGEPALLETSRQQLRTMAFILFPAVGGLIMVAPALGFLMIGEGLRNEALSVTPLISLGALFSGLNSYYFLQAFTLARKTRLLVIAMTIPAVSNIALNLFLIPRLGLMGAALASCMSFALGLAGSWFLGLKTLALPVPVSDLFKIAASVAVMMLVLSLLPGAFTGVTDALLVLAARALAGILLYGLLAYCLDLNSIRAPVNRVKQRFFAKVFA